MITADSLPDDVATLKALVLAGQAAQLAAEAKARNLEAEVRARTLLIEQMKFTIAKLKHEQHGQSSERASVLDQLELELADLEEDASEAEADAQLAAERAKAAKIDVQPFERRRPARAAAAPRPAAGARRSSRAGQLSMLWRGQVAQDRRGRDRDAGARAAAVEGDPARA